MAKEVRRLDILFKDPNASYKAGDVVTGKIYLELGGELKVKAIKLGLQGIARVGWDEEKSYTKGTSSKLSHKNMDVYLDETVFIVPRPETIRAGRYSWPFSVRLPPYLPAGFEGQYGRVMYWSKAVIERPWKGDYEITKNINVMGNLDLNTDPDAKKPVEALEEQQVGLFCKTGPVTGQIYLQRRGYVAGQTIPFRAKVDNNSKKKVNARVILSQVVIYRAEGQTRRTSNVMKGITKGEIRPGESAEWEDEVTNIPHVPPSRLGGGCKHIEIKYLLTLVASPAGPGKDLDVPVEVIIGTIPFRKAEGGTPKLTVKAAARKQSVIPPYAAENPGLTLG